MKSSFPPPFRTARLQFDPMVDADAAGIHAIRGLEEVMIWSHKKVPDADLATTEKWVEEYLRPEQRVPENVGYVIREIGSGSGSSASSGPVGGGDGDGKGEFEFEFEFEFQLLVLQATGRIIGSIGLRYGLVEEMGGKRWELGYIFHPDFWGKGYATEAVRGLMGAWPGIYQGITWGDVQQERSREVVAITDKGNEASMRVLSKCGFEAVEEFLDEAGMPCVAFVYRC
ncbi:GNAT family N-acetyltransferase [Aspergillus novofumigatus IBT 16806]|uniref:Putative GNAT family acetyltransferase n=1 Tax=Aspergillus novofumigatus (strain IBT 16806) TaxID=1392255 RepID=A0A2I1C7N6_ASPN1|nr:putative GNAT family acetyltransferase [Aspergillus novofumigatus IBT 16806]PKX93644.1 putative GNAT family acetyltransferase [Aspergillus novofumigatus IBT 16806]